MLMRKQLLTAFLGVLATLPADSRGDTHATGCASPVAPFVPSSDEDLAHYAALIAADYEQYFADITKFFACLQDWHQAVFEEAKEVTAQYEDFLERVDQMGGLPPAPLPGSGDPPGPEPADPAKGGD
jgi:hypothetical protein